MEMLDMRRSIRQFWPYYLGISRRIFAGSVPTRPESDRLIEPNASNPRTWVWF